jgi:hypothetical protein
MANIIINDNLEVNGKVTFNRAVNESKDGFIIEGIFLTHLYFDDIKTIQTKRYKLTGVKVYQEAFGSDDYNIGYYFSCTNLEILGQEVEGAKFILYPSEMKMIEDEMYKNEHPILGAIGEEYKDMIMKEEDVVTEEGSEK